CDSPCFKKFGQHHPAFHENYIQSLLLSKLVVMSLVKCCSLFRFKAVQVFPIPVQYWFEFFAAEPAAFFRRCVFPGLFQLEHLLNKLERSFRLAASYGFAIHKTVYPFAPGMGPAAHMGHTVQTMVT